MPHPEINISFIFSLKDNGKVLYKQKQHKQNAKQNGKQ